MIRPFAAVALFVTGVASQPLDGPELLARIKLHLRPSIVNLPNCKCLETINRTTYERDGSMAFRERLRLDVLIADSTELFSWPGSDAFTVKPLDNWADGGGALFNGSFWIQLHNLFQANASTVTYIHDEADGHQRLHRFDFRTPLLSSRYNLTVQGESATTAYSGSFWVNSESLDLVRLETRAEEIPPNIDCQREQRLITYARTALDVGDRLLPSSAEMTLVGRDGRESRNAITFSRCRHYGAEATLSFDTPAKPVDSVAIPAKSQMTLPPDLILVLQLEQPITIKDSAVGDPISARLVKAVKKREWQLAKGTRVVGRIRRLQQQFKGRHTSTVVGLEFFTAETLNGNIAFTAHLTGPQASPGELRMRDGMPSVTPGTPGLEIEDSGTSSGVGSFGVEGSEVNLPRGFRTIWQTH